ncbi:MAG: CpaD family pilus assembly protein [Brucellaceae bacterium]|jgi:pilus assembly protein CpaD|nr:CpaD family pilus assembly protein [Brucellaceae bacterium]
MKKIHFQPSRTMLISGSLFITLALAGCANTHHVTVGAIPDDYRTNHPITIQEREKTADIPVSRNDQKLSLTQRSIVQNAVDGYRRQGSGMVFILLPEGSANQSAAYRISMDIAKVLRQGGVLASNIATQSYQVNNPEVSAPVRISYYAMTAGTGPCGRWPDDMLDTSENKHYANFGCATQANLAAQVANPADFLGPRATAPLNGTRNDRVLSGMKKDSPDNGYDNVSPSLSKVWAENRSQIVDYTPRR